MVADAMGIALPGDVNAIRKELGSLGPWHGTRAEGPSVEPAGPVDGLVLASWRQLLDSGLMQEGEPYLAATARPTVAHLSAATAAGAGITDTVTVSGPTGEVTLPAVIAEVADGVVWVPTNSPGCHIHSDLGVVAGQQVSISAGGAA
jgi:NADH-quinone oxidoreductase subunit G